MDVDETGSIVRNVTKEKEPNVKHNYTEVTSMEVDITSENHETRSIVRNVAKTKESNVKYTYTEGINMEVDEYDSVGEMKPVEVEMERENHDGETEMELERDVTRGKEPKVRWEPTCRNNMTTENQYEMDQDGTMNVENINENQEGNVGARGVRKGEVEPTFAKNVTRATEPNVMCESTWRKNIETENHKGQGTSI